MAGKKTPRSETPEVDEQRTVSLQGQPVTTQVSVTTPERFQQLIESLKNQTTIKNDSGQMVHFSEEDKLEFIHFCEKAFPVIQDMVRTIHDVATLLDDVRKALKPKGLFIAWLDATSFPRRTAYNYLKLHGTFRDELPAYGHLGMKKLMAASTLRDGILFVKEHEEELTRRTVAEVETWIRDLKKTTKKGRGGRKPGYEQVGRFKIRIFDGGKKLVVEDLDYDMRVTLEAVIKQLLLKEK